MYKTITIFLLRVSGFDLPTSQVLSAGLHFLVDNTLYYFRISGNPFRHILHHSSTINFYPMKIILTLVLALGFTPAFAQTVDTITKVKGEPIQEKFPNRRNFDFKYEQFAPTDYAPDFNGEPKGTGRITNHYRFKAAVTVPVYTSDQWLINTSVKYKYEAFEFGDFIPLPGTTSAITQDPQDNYHLFTGSLSVTRFGSLFGKRMAYNGLIFADATDQDFGRVKGNLSATMILKRTRTTSFALGISAMIDRSAPIPFMPIISYQHAFNNDWALDVFLPQRLMIRKGVFKNGRISLGTEMENELLYVRIDPAQTGTLYDYRQMELKSGLTYEHNLGHNIIATFKGGMTNYMNARGVIKGQSSDTYEFRTHPDPTGYFSLGVSFHPFEK